MIGQMPCGPGIDKKKNYGPSVKASLPTPIHNRMVLCVYTWVVIPPQGGELPEYSPEKGHFVENPAETVIGQ